MVCQRGRRRHAAVDVGGVAQAVEPPLADDDVRIEHDDVRRSRHLETAVNVRRKSDVALAPEVVQIVCRVVDASQLFHEIA